MDRHCDCDFVPSMPVGSIRALEITPFPYVSAGDDLPSGWEDFLSERDQNPQNQQIFLNKMLISLIKENKRKEQQKEKAKQVEKEAAESKLEEEKQKEIKRKLQEAQTAEDARQRKKAAEEAERLEQMKREQESQQDEGEVSSPVKTRSKSKNKAPQEEPFTIERADITPFRKSWFELTDAWAKASTIENTTSRREAQKRLNEKILELAENLGIVNSKGVPYKSVKVAWVELNGLLQTDIKYSS